MATPTIKLVNAIRKAAHKIEKGADYQWGHMGACNCGHLAQELTPYSKAEIHAYAMRKSGDWTDQVMDYCADSAMPMDEVISTMMQNGLSREDLVDLERLKNPDVRERMGARGQSLHHNIQADVVAYMRTWADMLEEEMVNDLDISDLNKKVREPALIEKV